MSAQIGSSNLETGNLIQAEQQALQNKPHQLAHCTCAPPPIREAAAVDSLPLTYRDPSIHIGVKLGRRLWQLSAESYTTSELHTARLQTQSAYTIGSQHRPGCAACTKGLAAHSTCEISDLSQAPVSTEAARQIPPAAAAVSRARQPNHSPQRT